MISCLIQDVNNDNVLVSEPIERASENVVENIGHISMWEIWVNPINITILIVGFAITFLLWSLYGKKGRLGFMNLVPTIWTSLGILGTFFSIVNSLAINPNSFEDVKVLIEKVAPAFTSSIIGICFSIMTSLWIKYLQMLQDKTELASIGNKTPEQTLYDLLMAERGNSSILRKIADYSEKQPTLLKNFLDEHLKAVHDFYESLYDKTEEHARIIADKYLESAIINIKENDKKLNQLVLEILTEHASSLKESIETENSQLENLRSDVKNAISSLPGSIEIMKNELLSVLKKAITDKFALIIQENSDAINELLKQIGQMRSSLATNASNDAKVLINDIEDEVVRIIGLLQTATSNNATELSKAMADINDALSKINASVNKSSDIHTELVENLNTLLPLLQQETQKATSAISANETIVKQIEEVLKNLETISNKNQQLTFELAQWKRVHKQVEIDQQKGTKKCPNCGTENSIEANYCRRCTFSFWATSTAK